MATTNSMQAYPHYIVNVFDISRDDVATEVALPLHFPIFPIQAEKGPVGVIRRCKTINESKKIYGEATYDENYKYFNNDTLFAQTALGSSQIFQVRLASNSAKTAHSCYDFVLEEYDVPQYERDENGNFKYTEDGDKIPIVDEESSTQVTIPGYKLKIVKKQYEEDDKFNKRIEKTVSGSGSGDIVHTPFLDVEALSPGAYGNRSGFKMWYDAKGDLEDFSISNNIAFFNISPVDKEYDSDIVTPIRNSWSTQYTSFCFKPDVIDNSTKLALSFDKKMENNYYTYSETDTLLPYKIAIYLDNISKLCQKIVEKDPDLTENDIWSINFLTGTYLDGTPLKSLEVDVESLDATFFNEEVIQYLDGGDDGYMDKEEYEQMYSLFLKGNIFPQIVDKSKYPFTHLYDSGYSLKTKEALIDFLTLRDDVAITLATQDVANDYNTEEEDMSAGLHLETQCLLHPESLVGNTSACRASITAHAGVLNGTYTKMVPASYWLLVKRLQFQSGSYISGEPKEDPNSLVTQFKTINWTAYDDTRKSNFWDSGINYIEAYNLETYHYADYQTIYPWDNSVLSDITYVDAIVYAKHEVRKIHKKFSGSTRPKADLFVLMEKEATTRLNLIFNGRYPFTIRFYQTENEVKLGFASHAQLVIYGEIPNRVDTFDIYCDKITS